MIPDDGLTDRQRRIQDVRLVEHPDPGPGARGHASLIRVDPSCEDLHEGRFAVAVAPDDADAVAAGDTEGDTVEHLSGAEREGSALDRDDDGH